MSGLPQFTRASKRQSWLRLALLGPAGSGKTYTALGIASCLGRRVAVMDTEHRSANKYADLFEFDTFEPTSFEPLVYVEAMKGAVQAGYDVIILDSLSHAWSGRGGLLEQVDETARRDPSHNSFNAWRTATPQHNRLIDALLAAPIHVIVTMRVKTEFVVEKDDRGKSVPRKVGVQPVQRDGLEYEFDVVADLDADNLMTIGKTRCPALRGRCFEAAGKDERPGYAFSQVVSGWLGAGTERLALAEMLAVPPEEEEEDTLPPLPEDAPADEHTPALVRRRIYAAIGAVGKADTFEELTQRVADLDAAIIRGLRDGMVKAAKDVPAVTHRAALAARKIAKDMIANWPEEPASAEGAGS